MFKIPILKPHEHVTPAYTEALRVAIESDGCSDSPDIYGSCCVLHDLGYRFGIDCYGQPVKKSDTDAILRRCMQGKSKLGRFSPVSWIYWAALHYLGWKAYGSDIDQRGSYETYLFNA